MRFNLIGTVESLTQLLKRWSSTVVQEHFSSMDINVEVHEDYIDDFTDLADDLNVKWTML